MASVVRTVTGVFTSSAPVATTKPSPVGRAEQPLVRPWPIAHFTSPNFAGRCTVSREAWIGIRQPAGIRFQ